MTKITANITFKSILSSYTDLEKRNKHFDSLSNEGKRLEIAWDALQLVLNGQIFASIGCYWSQDLRIIHKPDPKKFQKTLINELPECCFVCQRGAIMLSTIRIGNKISSNDLYRDNGNSSNIQGFSLTNMINMENEYENSIYGHPYSSHTEEKMANILCNILVNGNFNKHDNTNYLTVKY